MSKAGSVNANEYSGALYRKYRSRKLDEVVGQEHITNTLKNAISAGKISHAYLFTGPRGVGKTSVARILAHEVNSLDYKQEANHLDIIEIDAASNRGIDEIRDLREKAYTAPSSLKYKVYIIDEVHMLTQPAFNALLKILEEPPGHVIFVLATTEAHKIPTTIISRTQRHSFRPIPLSESVKRLRYIADQEKIKISDEALELIAQYGEGSLRDSISILDQVHSASTQMIDADHVRRLLGLVNEHELKLLTKTASSGNFTEAAKHIYKMIDSGITPELLSKQWLNHLRNYYLTDDFPIEFLVNLSKNLLDISQSYADKQIALVNAVYSVANALNTQNKQNVKNANTQQNKDSEVEKTQSTHIKNDSPIDNVQEAHKTSQNVSNFDQTAWLNLLEKIKSSNNSLYAVLRMAKPVLVPDKGVVILEFGFPFHKKRVDEIKNKQLIESYLKEILGRTVIIDTKLNRKLIDFMSESESGPEVKPMGEEINLDAILSKMGGGEIVDYNNG